MKTASGRYAIVELIGAVFLCSTVIQTPFQAQAQPNGAGIGTLQKEVENPAANLINIEFQNNTNFPIGAFRRVQNAFSIKPVIPFRISENWHLITRTILSVTRQPDITRSTGSTSGLSDLNPSAFLTPSNPGRLIWGVGPTFVLPTATREELGDGKWSAGPTAAVFVQPDNWTLGVLARNVWSFAGDPSRSGVNSFTLEYFIELNFENGWYLTSNPTITANWKLPPGERWIVPVGPGLGRVFKVKSQSFNANVSAYYNVAHSPGLFYPRWQIATEFALLFPKDN
jgi:hypothetical protein